MPFANAVRKTEYQREYKVRNKERLLAYCKRWRREDPDRRRTSELPGRLRRSYGITLETYDVLLESQGGVCRVCYGVNPDGEMLSVDHDHATRHVRGLLCHRCNIGIGAFRDNPEFLKRATTYVRKGYKG